MKITLGFCRCGGRVNVELGEFVACNGPTRLAQIGVPSCERCAAVPILDTVDSAGRLVPASDSDNPWSEAAKHVRPIKINLPGAPR